jgi:hypothetical protein
MGMGDGDEELVVAKPAARNDPAGSQRQDMPRPFLRVLQRYFLMGLLRVEDWRLGHAVAR